MDKDIPNKYPDNYYFSKKTNEFAVFNATAEEVCRLRLLRNQLIQRIKGFFEMEEDFRVA